MKKLLLALGLWLVAIAPAWAQAVGGQPVICNNRFQVSQGAVALTKIVSGVTGTQITICGYAANAGAAAATFQLSYGTGTNCGTNTTAIVPVYSLAINGVMVDHNPYAMFTVPQFTSGVISDLCLVTTGTGPLAITVWYGQF